MEKPIVLVIMDGVGKGDGGSGDAVVARSHSEGNQTGVAELISAPVLKEPVMIQYRGKVNRIAMMVTATTEKYL